MTVEPTLDHLVYAVADLESAIAAFTALTGVTPAVGGRHLGKGTRNYLVGLGPTAYLEIIGPDPEHPAEPGVPSPFGADQVVGSKLLTWSIHPEDPDRMVEQARNAGADLGELVSMSRKTESGDVLSWRLASVLPLPADGVVPFIIDWGSTPHPAASGLPQLELVSLTATHPEAADVARIVEAMHLTLSLTTGTAGLQVVLGTPNGRVTLV